jgi:transposase
VGGGQNADDPRARLVSRELGEGAVVARGGKALPLDLGHRFPVCRARRSLGAGAPQPRPAKSVPRRLCSSPATCGTFRNVIRKRCSTAIHVLDRFHVTKLLNEAVDKVRREEVRSLRAAGRPAMLTKTRWLLLKRRENMSTDERGRLRELLRINLRSVRACLLKEQFQRFWDYSSGRWGEKFLARWTTGAMRSRLEPFKKFARTLRKHRRELLAWFAARGSFAHGATEGFNNKAQITTRKAYGFRRYEHAEIALYHALGELPEPDWLTHRFC